jgi:hypothetical protein
MPSNLGIHPPYEARAEAMAHSAPSLWHRGTPMAQPPGQIFACAAPAQR